MHAQLGPLLGHGGHVEARDSASPSSEPPMCVASVPARVAEGDIQSQAAVPSPDGPSPMAASLEEETGSPVYEMLLPDLVLPTLALMSPVGLARRLSGVVEVVAPVGPSANDGPESVSRVEPALANCGLCNDGGVEAQVDHEVATVGPLLPADADSSGVAATASLATGSGDPEAAPSTPPPAVSENPEEAPSAPMLATICGDPVAAPSSSPAASNSPREAPSTSCNPEGVPSTPLPASRGSGRHLSAVPSPLVPVCHWCTPGVGREPLPEHHQARGPASWQKSPRRHPRFYLHHAPTGLANAAPLGLPSDAAAVLLELSPRLSKWRLQPDTRRR